MRSGLPVTENRPTRRGAWSLFAGVAILCLSLWLLHRFCDDYPLEHPADSLSALSADPVCSQWLGPITWVGGFGVICLLGSWMLGMLSLSFRDLMKAFLCTILITALLGCASEGRREPPSALYLGEEPPTDRPKLFRPEIIPEGQLAHAGVFTPDMQEYYCSLSDATFDEFTVVSIRRSGEGWTEPEPAFFNSPYKEHGVHFTMDGQWAYFSSTRPTPSQAEAPEAQEFWRIWRSRKTAEGWSEAELVEIPGMEGRTYSHPSVARSGRIYFHSYLPDFSDMALFFADPTEGGGFHRAEKVALPEGANANTLTPYVASDESYLLFTTWYQTYYVTSIAHRNEGAWQAPQSLGEAVNTRNLGNPFVTPDGKYLFFATGDWPQDAPAHDWVIRWVSTEGLLAP